MLKLSCVWSTASPCCPRARRGKAPECRKLGETFRRTKSAEKRAIDVQQRRGDVREVMTFRHSICVPIRMRGITAG